MKVFNIVDTGTHIESGLPRLKRCDALGDLLNQTAERIESCMRGSSFKARQYAHQQASALNALSIYVRQGSDAACADAIKLLNSCSISTVEWHWGKDMSLSLLTKGK